MTTALTPALALEYVRALSADIRAGVVLAANGDLLAGPERLAAPARALLASAETRAGEALHAGEAGAETRGGEARQAGQAGAGGALQAGGAGAGEARQGGEAGAETRAGEALHAGAAGAEARAGNALRAGEARAGEALERGEPGAETRAGAALRAGDAGPALIEGATDAGAVYAARDDRHAIVVVTGPFALPRVTRHDLQTALSALGGGASESSLPRPAERAAITALIAAAADAFRPQSVISRPD